MNLPQIKTHLEESFNKSELKDLCFDLGIKFENLPGSTRVDKSRELVHYYYRRGCLSELILKCKKLRPNVFWPEVQDLWGESVVIKHQPGSAPCMPSLLIGRETDLNELKSRISVKEKTNKQPNIQVLTTVSGWPGVGKTTVASAIAHDQDIANIYSDGVLWISLGQNPNILSGLIEWGRALNIDQINKVSSIQETSSLLTAHLRDQKRLLVVDDVWVPEHVEPFNVGGRDCALLVTSRLYSFTSSLAPVYDSIFRLPVLDDEASWELFKILAPTVANNFPDESHKLVESLEGLPLAIQVAGRFLNTEASYGFDVSELFMELEKGAKLLEISTPSNFAHLIESNTPSMAAVLKRSIDCLDATEHRCFALLGPFAPKPAVFSFSKMKSLWKIEDPKRVAMSLVTRGLLEPVDEIGRFQMHSTLVMVANSLLE